MVAEDILSPIDVPPFDNSAMDGVALRLDDLKGDSPWLLPIHDVIAAGDAPVGVLPPGQAVKIMTGAPMVSGADTVIKVEDVEFQAGGALIRSRPKPNQHIRARGNDLMRGDLIFEAGEILKAVDVGILAATGHTHVNVIPKPKIALFTTGSEVDPPGESLSPGHIYNSNDTSLQALLDRDGYSCVTVLSPVKDDFNLLSDIIRSALEEYQLVITSGAVSMGDFDFIPQVVKETGGTILFHKVKIKPGKPVLFARFDRSEPDDSPKWLVSLPGNPVSVVVGYHLYVKRVLHRMTRKPYETKSTTAKLTSDIKVEGVREKVIGVWLKKTSDGWLASPSLRQQSGRIASIKGIDGFMVIEGGERELSEGDEVRVEWL